MEKISYPHMVDTSLETYMTCVGEYEIKSLKHDHFIKNNNSKL